MPDEQLLELAHRAIDMMAWARSRIEWCRAHASVSPIAGGPSIANIQALTEWRTLEAVLRQLEGEETPDGG